MQYPLGEHERDAECLNIDLSISWMIGDSENDVKAGQAAGCKTALIGNDEFSQNITGNNLLGIINEILGD